MDDRAESSSVKFLVVRDNQLGEWFDSSKNNVASVLSSLNEPGFEKRLYTLAARDSRKGTHTARSRVSKFSGGTGSLSSSKDATYP